MSIATETLGHLAALGCAFTWAVATLIFGRVTASVEVRTLNFVKCTAAALLLALTSWLTGDVPALDGRALAVLVGSSVLGIVIADTAYFVVLREIGAARGVLFISLVPVCTALLAAPLLDEPLTARMGAGMLLTLAGVVIVVRGALPAMATPQATRSPWGMLAGVIYAASQAGANVLTKTAVHDAPALVVATMRMGIGALLLGLWLVVAFRGRPPIVQQARLLRPVAGPVALASLLGTYIGMLFGTYAIGVVNAGVSTTLAATTPLWALLLNRVLYGETPSLRTAAGAVMAMLGVALLVL